MNRSAIPCWFSLCVFLWLCRLMGGFGGYARTKFSFLKTDLKIQTNKTKNHHLREKNVRFVLHLTTKIKVSKEFSIFKEIHWILVTQVLGFVTTVTRLLLSTASPKMTLESLLRVLWHFWNYIEWFSELSESTEMHFEAFRKRWDEFFETFKKSVLNFEICRNFYLSLV